MGTLLRMSGQVPVPPPWSPNGPGPLAGPGPSGSSLGHWQAQPEAVSSACAATGTGTGTSSPRFPTGTGSCVDQASKVAHGMGMCASLDLGLVAVSSGCREASRCEYLG